MVKLIKEKSELADQGEVRFGGVCDIFRHMVAPEESRQNADKLLAQLYATSNSQFPGLKAKSNENRRRTNGHMQVWLRKILSYFLSLSFFLFGFERFEIDYLFIHVQTSAKFSHAVVANEMKVSLLRITELKLHTSPSAAATAFSLEASNFYRVRLTCGAGVHVSEKKKSNAPSWFESFAFKVH
jgi:hypothetical protein